MASVEHCSRGSISFDVQGVAIGWAALGEAGKGLPIWNASRDICLVIIGQLFSESTESPALSAIVADYERDSASFARRLNGQFAGVLVDLRGPEPKTVVFNDRYALCRIYYHQDDDTFYFSTEARPILSVAPATRTPNWRAISESLVCGCSLRWDSFHQGINLFPGASLWRFSGTQQPARSSYFKVDELTACPALSPQEFYPKLLQTFREILPRYLVPAKSVGISLTGGVDSRMIMAWLDSVPGQVPCYSFIGPVRECFDVSLGRKVAAICGQPHQTIPVDEEFFTEFPNLLAQTARLSNGTMDPTGTVELYVNRKAHSIAPIRLTGNYGGEILRSSISLRTRRVNALAYDPEFVRTFENARAAYRDERAGLSDLAFIVSKQLPWFHYSRFSIEASQVLVRSPYIDNDLVRCAFQVPPELSSSKQFSLWLIRDGNPRLRDIPTDRGLLPDRNSLVDRLRQRARMFTVKAEYAYDYGMPQWFVPVDNMFTPLHLERLFLGRNKFYHFRYWYRHQLANVVKEILLDPKTLGRPYLNKTGVERIVLDHVGGHKNYTTEIHQLLSTEMMHRQILGD